MFDLERARLCDDPICLKVLPYIHSGHFLQMFRTETLHSRAVSHSACGRPRGAAVPGSETGQGLGCDVRQRVNQATMTPLGCEPYIMAAFRNVRFTEQHDDIYSLPLSPYCQEEPGLICLYDYDYNLFYAPNYQRPL